MRFKLQRGTSATQPFYFEIQAAGNYETLATSETYVSKSDAQHAIDLIKAGAGGATVVDARLAARREKLLAGAKPLRSMEELGIPDITEEEARAFAEAMGW